MRAATTASGTARSVRRAPAQPAAATPTVTPARMPRSSHAFQRARSSARAHIHAAVIGRRCSCTPRANHRSRRRERGEAPPVSGGADLPSAGERRLAPLRRAGRRPVERVGRCVLRQVAGRRRCRRPEGRGPRRRSAAPGGRVRCAVVRRRRRRAVPVPVCVERQRGRRRGASRAGSLRRADIVVWSAGSAIAADPACAPRALHDAFPDTVVVALSPFGLDGPWDDRPTNDFTRQALCGGHVQRGTPARPPLMCGGAPGEWAAGTYGAIGALAARRRVTAGGPGDLVDVAALDALMYSQPLYPVTWFQIAGEPFRPLRSSQLPSVHPTADGWVSLQTTTGQQWLDFCVMVGRDDWLADEQMARGTHRTLHRDEIEPAIDAWTVDAPDCGDRRARHRAAHPGRRGGQRRQPSALRPSGRTRCVRHQRARLHPARGAVPPRWRRITPSVRRGADRRSRHRRASGAGHRGAGARRRAHRSTTRRCRSPASACSTSPRSGPDRSSGTRAPSSAPR